MSFNFNYLQTTPLTLQDSLPLTCSRSGTCCHGNLVRLNPWELSRLSKAKAMSAKAFQKHYTVAGGSILHFNGTSNKFGKKACGLYEEGVGCSVHSSRPLACRLFPIGRQIQNGEAQYIFQGKDFPCLNECPEVVDLPHLSVEEYLSGQETKPYENAQDEYMEVMQNMADIALSLLLDTGLAATGDTKTLRYWKELKTKDLESLATDIGEEWMEMITQPALENIEEPVAFARIHNDIIQEKAQGMIESLTSFERVRFTAQLMMAIAIFFAHSIGADASGLLDHWIDIARENGAMG